VTIVMLCFVVLTVTMLDVIFRSVIMLGTILLNVALLSVVAPHHHLHPMIYHQNVEREPLENERDGREERKKDRERERERTRKRLYWKFCSGAKNSIAEKQF